MTASPQPQQEYIITEQDICFAEGVTGYKYAAFRSRPHTQAPACNYPDMIVCPNAILCSECNVNNIAAEAARTATLAIITLLKTADETGCPPHKICESGITCRDCVVKWIETSLRTTAQEDRR